MLRVACQAKQANLNNHKIRLAWGRYLETDDDGQERTVTDARGSVSALAELRQNKTTPLFLKSGEGFGEGENFGADVRPFLVKRSFPLPQEPSTLIGNFVSRIFLMQTE